MFPILPGASGAPAASADQGSSDADAGADSGPSDQCRMLMDMGFPRDYCEFALNRTGGVADAAIAFIIEHDGDMDRWVCVHRLGVCFL